jgi:asparagine synthase (glutamine-hydrolysing)
MAGIAGIARKGAEKEITEMLDLIKHRGKSGMSVFETEGTTVGINWHNSEKEIIKRYMDEGKLGYDNGPGHYVWSKSEKGKFVLYRDETGVAPLYYGKDISGNMCYASEVKALLPFCSKINELPPGHYFDGDELVQYYSLNEGTPLLDEPQKIADELRSLLENAVLKSIRSENTGAWLSGGLDSSVISALGARHIKKLHTISGGLKGAPDLEYARETAKFIKSIHHEVIIDLNDLIKALPDVIYYLESFDALLVRSSITNYLVAKKAGEYVTEVFSGEGGDELFAGYDYLKSIPISDLGNELKNITNNLHNTALQRVDRCASANGTAAHVIFTNPDVVKYSFTIPARYKINNGVEKWILRKALESYLPDGVLKRPKAKFWEGAGVKDLISNYADNQITDNEFRTERILSNGWKLNTREELFYYRIFKDHFGPDVNLNWMGRTEGSPVSE